MLATDSKLPLPPGAEKRSYVRAMFTAIAPRYDFLNHLLSLNVDPALAAAGGRAA